MFGDLTGKILVIGGNAAGLAAASQARRIDPEVSITVLQSGDFISYGSCSLSYYISGEVKELKDIFAYPKEFFEDKRNIKILTGHKVTSLDTVSKKVEAKTREGTLYHDYDKLVISTGAECIIPEIEGIDAYNVFKLRDVGDALAIDSFIKDRSPKKAIVLGGGSIGLLLAESLIKLGIKVTIIEFAETILSSFENEISTVLYKKATLGKANILAGSKLVEIIKNSNNQAEKVRIDTPEGIVELETDMMILATGIKANTSFLKNNGLSTVELGIKDAIKVTSKQQTTHLNIYAAGDCCLCKNIITGKYDYIPTANNAVKMGRIAGENIMGGNLDFNGSVGTRVDSLFGSEIAKSGLGLDEAREQGFDAVKVTGTYPSHVRALGKAKEITVSIIFEDRTGRLLGAQMIGEESVGKRIDIFAAALTGEMDVNQVYMLDLSYTPKISTVWDPVNKICAKALLYLKNRKA